MFKLYSFIFILIPILVISQNTYQVKYKMTTLFDGIKNYDAKLTFFGQKACFEYKLFAKDTMTVEREDTEGHKIIVIPDKNRQLVITDFMDKKISELKSFNSKILVEDTLSMPVWHITNEIKSISNYESRKATTFYKGRNYEVWFTIDIATNFGPWKLHGLPGLIILAEDKTKEVYFEAIEIKKTDESICQEDNFTKRISKEKYEMAIKKRQKDYEEQLKAMGDRNLQFDVKFGKAIGIEISY